MEEKDEIIISPKLIGEILKRNAVFIAVVVVLAVLGTFFYTNFFVTKQYTSTLSLYVETVDVQSDSPSAASASLTMQNYALKLVPTYIRMLDTNTFYTELSERLSEKYTPTQLSKMISFKSDENTEVFDVKVVSPSPTESKKIADTIAEVAPETISNLKTNAKLKVCDESQLPTKHSSPSVSRNVIIAFFASLIVSVGIAFIRHFMDKKIKYDDEMTQIFDIPVLAAIPSFDSYISQKGKESAQKSKEGSVKENG